MQVITSLPPADAGAELNYHKLDDQMDLLTKVNSRCAILYVSTCIPLYVV